MEKIILTNINSGCLQCDSKNIIEIGNNHHLTNDKLEYLEHHKCLQCNYEFVD